MRNGLVNTTEMLSTLPTDEIRYCILSQNVALRKLQLDRDILKYSEIHLKTSSFLRKRNQIPILFSISISFSILDATWGWDSSK